MRLHGVDAELIDRERVRSMLPFLDFDNARFPIQGGLLQKRGGTARHDAVVWGYARAANRLGVDIVQNSEVTGFLRDGGRITGIGPGTAADADRSAAIVAPAFVDIQINGGGGVLFNADPSPEGIAAILAAHRRFGTTRLLPTLITDAPEVAEAIAAIDGVSEVYSVTGQIDLITLVRVASHDDIAAVVADRLNKVDGVLSTETHIAFRAYSQHDLDAAFSLGLD